MPRGLRHRWPRKAHSRPHSADGEGDASDKRERVTWSVVTEGIISLLLRLDDVGFAPSAGTSTFGGGKPDARKHNPTTDKMMPQQSARRSGAREGQGGDTHRVWG